jgi:hypothetical protein
MSNRMTSGTPEVWFADILIAVKTWVVRHGGRQAPTTVSPWWQASHVPDLPALPSLDLILDQVASERETMNTHAESLDAKAGVVLGFSGVLVGLGATAQPGDSNTIIFQIGLGVAVLAAALAAWAFLPRGYPVLQVGLLRERYLTAPEHDTRLRLLDTQIDMVRRSALLLKQKGLRVRLSVISLALGATLVVIGTLTAGGK